MSLPATKRIEIMLQNASGQLEYEQHRLIFDALKTGKDVGMVSPDWGPRMRAALEADSETLIDWLIEIGILVPTDGGSFVRGSVT